MWSALALFLLLTTDEAGKQQTTIHAEVANPAGVDGFKTEEDCLNFGRAIEGYTRSVDWTNDTHTGIMIGVSCLPSEFAKYISENDRYKNPQFDSRTSPLLFRKEWNPSR